MTSSSPPRVDRTASTITAEKQIRKLRAQLLLQKRWSYHRYLHFREALLVAHDVASVLVIGAGRALAELMLAIEFPEIRFFLTDVQSARTPNFGAAERCAVDWGLTNVEFGVLDVTEPIRGRYDLVASIEVLEHLEVDERAMANMVAAANRYVFCLVPFASEAALRDPALAARAWRRNEHYRYGYSPERLRALLPDIVEMRGCYWRDRGYGLRAELSDLDEDAIRDRAEELASRGLADVVHEVPRTIDEAQGIWALARVNDQDARPSGAPAPPTKIGLDDVTRRRLDEIRRRLVFFRSWNLFRYLHLRQAFLETSGVDSVLSVGCGRGLAELALAVEFPDVQIQLTEVDSDALAMTRPVSELAEAWKLENLTFGIQDVLEPLQNRADLVCAVDVLSQVEDDVLAASHLRAASDGYVFCLVPFATGAAQADERLRSRAWEKRRSYRVGYSEDDLRALFPGQSIVRGCFWSHSGARVQATMAALDEAALLPRTAELCEAAECDLEKRVPRRHREALGIWILARSAGG